MGIKQLMKLINEKAPSAVRKITLEQYSGKVIACDASMAIYQCLIAPLFKSQSGMLSDESGNPTSHLMGLLSRTIQLLEHNIKPIWVFDGKAPEEKSQELTKRKLLKKKNQDKLREAQGEILPTKTPREDSHIPYTPTESHIPMPKCAEIPISNEKNWKNRKENQTHQRRKFKKKVDDIETELRLKISSLLGYEIPIIESEDYLCKGESDEEEVGLMREIDAMVGYLSKNKYSDIEEVKKIARRTVHITKEMVDDAKKLLHLMGVPVIEAPGEAEAQCAELVKNSRAYAVLTEDMDTLAFGANIMVRGMGSKNEPMVEITLENILRDFQMKLETFIDLCILLGCDYTSTIEGIGHKRAFALLQECSSIENVINVADKGSKGNFKVPSDFDYNKARNLFLHPVVSEPDQLDLNWEVPNEGDLRDFLMVQKDFGKEKINGFIRRLNNISKKPAQMRLDAFYDSETLKRPPEDTKKIKKKAAPKKKKK
ncbi:unnamed protein product [Blepharisma stoltei]|uniref:Flap endonuclease 1 n=1 Tax=Blepharisma stoltei TaxID=1481888 RepID=A0AAU9ICK9_9CILI|nr:unnamed protein product [Blepharisma stoltei]